MAKSISFEDLECWKQAKTLTVDIYKYSMQGKLSMDFELRNQLRKSAVSIVSNIAEGKERKTPADLIRFLYIAKASAAELRTQLILTKEIGYIKEEDFQPLIEKAIRISSMLGALIKSIRK